MIRSTIARVDLEALKSNFEAVRRFLASASEPDRSTPPGIIAVVKANAYGHGSPNVARAPKPKAPKAEKPAKAEAAGEEAAPKAKKETKAKAESKAKTETKTATKKSAKKAED